MTELMLSGVIVGLIAMLLWTPALMAMGISRLEGELTFGEKALCWIPVFNVIRAEVKYYGKLRLITLSTVTFVIVSVFRVFVWWNLYEAVTIGTVSVVLFWIALVFVIVSNMSFVYDVINDTGVLNGGKLVLYALAYPFGQYYIGNYLVNVVKHMQAKEDTFKR